MHPPTSDHNIVTARETAWLLPSQPTGEEGKETATYRSVTADPNLRQEVVTAIGDHLRAVPPSCSSVDVETVSTTAILQTTKRVAPPRERRLPGRGWMGDAQAEAEINMAMTAIRLEVEEG